MDLLDVQRTGEEAVNDPDILKMVSDVVDGAEEYNSAEDDDAPVDPKADRGQ